MLTFGLIGSPLTHSFSEKYFSEKFVRENITDTFYKLFPLANISEFPEFIKKNPGIRGLNVTIPYKEKIIPYLDKIDDTAYEIGAVNTIKYFRDNFGDRLLMGYNTDAYGFEVSLKSFIGRKKPKALIFGSGGSSKAVQYVLNKLKIKFQIVSRNSILQKSKIKPISYFDFTEKIIREHTLIINCTPLGMYPAVESCPNIPYQWLSSEHFLFDLVYNPEETLFLKKGKEQGAKTKNGLEMLHLQAEKSWEIWNDKD